MAYSTGTLAQGCFGKVYKEKYNDTLAAIKRVPMHLISKKDLQRESQVYKKANHPNIVKLLGDITLKDGKWVIPLEFIFGEDLETTIFKASKSKIQLTASNRGTIIVGMCDGLLHLHSKDIVHQDLKPENIMVEHNTNRAVIIDLGLAKFYKYGLSSAMDMGNEAYSAPEVLQRGSQRDQRSDVWAMGKIIAELCARIRLYTPTVCPAKIKETLQDQPYVHAVCRMVVPDPSLRASIGGVIEEIRKAGGAGVFTKTPVEKDHLKPSSPHVNARNRSPRNRDPSPIKRDPSPFNRDPPLFKRDPSPFNRDPPLFKRDQSPFNRDPSPFNRDQSPFRRDQLKKDPAPFKRDQSPLHKSPSPLNWERSPKPELKVLHHGARQPPTHVPYTRAEEVNREQAVVPAGGAGTNITQDFMKMKLRQEVAKDLPCNLPTTGRVVVRRFEEKDGEVGSWEQQEVVTRDGRIVKFDNIKFNSK